MCKLKKDYTELRNNININAEIKSLSEFIKCIESNNLYNYIYRGENQLWENPLSSSLARDNCSPLNFDNLINDFYFEIEPDLTNVQKRNFVALARHHGIPTPIVDFSLSPLVALFFSCLSSYNPFDCGYVYCIKSNKSINIDDYVIKDYCFNPLDKLMSNDFDFLIDVANKLWLLFSNEDYVNYFLDWFCKYVNYLTNILRANNQTAFADDIDFEINNFKKYIKSIKWGYSFVFNFKLKELSKFFSDKDMLSYFIRPFALFSWCDVYENIFIKLNDSNLFEKFIVVSILLFTLVINHESSNDSQELSLNYLPFNFKYRPQQIIERVSNQKSIFLYHPYSSFYHPINIISDFVIKINNKNDILDQLEHIGIDEYFIYGGYDYLAKKIIGDYDPVNTILRDAYRASVSENSNK